MYFDPLSSWIVLLLVNGATVVNEKTGVNEAQEEHERECEARWNNWLNIDIKKLQDQWGLNSPEYSLEKIKSYIQRTEKQYPFNCGRGNIFLDRDSQKYVIALLEKCATIYDAKLDVESQEKAKWYKDTVSEARKLESQYAEIHTERERDREKRENKKFLYLLIGGVILTIIYELIKLAV